MATFGSANSNPDLFMGALTTLAGDEARAKQALALAEQLTPELQEFDPYLAAIKYCSSVPTRSHSLWVCCTGTCSSSQLLRENK